MRKPVKPVADTKARKKSAQPVIAEKKNGKAGKLELPSRFYGSPLPGVKPEELSGTLVVIEARTGRDAPRKSHY